MNLTDDFSAFWQSADEAIKRFGFAPEHNMYWYQYATEAEQKPVFVQWPNGTALLTQKENGKWYIFSEPLAGEGERGKRIVEFAYHVFGDSNVKKVVVELRTETRKEALSLLSNSSLRACSINYTLTWPVMNFSNFNADIPGGHFKSIRNARSKFYREHKVAMVEAATVSSDDLRKIVYDWKKFRHGHDRSFYDRYLNIIGGHFKGFHHAQAMIVDGRPVGFNAGWEIPRSDRYYASVGIHDYSVEDLGLILYLEDLIWMKNAGYIYADMGGGEKALTNFKNQFLPESQYQTFVFSIMRR